MCAHILIDQQDPRFVCHNATYGTFSRPPSEQNILKRHWYSNTQATLDLLQEVSNGSQVDSMSTINKLDKHIFCIEYTSRFSVVKQQLGYMYFLY